MDSTPMNFFLNVSKLSKKNFREDIQIETSIDVFRFVVDDFSA